MIDVLSKVAKIKGHFDSYPMTVPGRLVPDGPIMGNGDMGVVTAASKNSVDFYFTKNDFWYAATGAKGGGIKPMGYLHLNFPESSGEIKFRAEQKILYAEICTELTFKNGAGAEQKVMTRSYVLREKNLFVTEITCEKGDPRFRVDLVPVKDMNANFSHSVRRNDITLTKSYEGDDLPWETFGYVKGRIIGCDMNPRRITEGETVYVIIGMATNHDGKDYVAEVDKMLEGDVVAALPSLWEAHTEWWNKFWQSSAVDLPSFPDIETFWYASHYIMACCNHPGKIAPGIFGNWISDEFPEWASDYHLNYNYEAPWWGMYSSNKISLTEPYDRPLLDCIPAMKRNARSFLNCNGLYSLVGIGPKGLEVTIQHYRDGTRSIGTGFWGQKSNAAYAAVNMVMRFYSTYDKEYALNCAYPYMREVALFWEDYLRFVDGRYVIYNDCVNENIYAGIGIYDWATPDAIDRSNDFNPIISLALIRMVLKTLIDICRFAEIEDDHIPKWEHILAHLSEFPTYIRNGERIFRLTETGEDWNDDNSLAVQHIYPCGAIGLSSDGALLETARRTVRQMDRWGPDYNAFPTYYTAAVRVGYDPETILSKLRGQLAERPYNNFFIFYGGGGIECCSTVPNCINEMLFQSHEGILRFFPVWQRELDAEFEDLRGYGAFLASAEIKNGIVGEITIKSEKGRDCSVQCPWESGMTVTCGTEEIPCDLSEDKGLMICTFKSEEGKVYKLIQK